MGNASIARVGARIVWIIGARGDSFAFEVQDDRFDKHEIAQAIVETESELVRDFAESYHAERIPFLVWAPSAGLDSGDVIPTHIGQIEGIRIFPFDMDTDDLNSIDLEDANVKSGQATTQTNVQMWRENYHSDDDADGIFDAEDFDQDGSILAGYYNRTNDTLDFVGTKAQVKIVDYTPDYSDGSPTDYGSLQISDIWESDLVAGTVAKLAKLGVTQDILQQNTSAYMQARSLIRTDAKPEVDVVQKMQ